MCLRTYCSKLLKIELLQLEGRYKVKRIFVLQVKVSESVSETEQQKAIVLILNIDPLVHSF